MAKKPYYGKLQDPSKPVLMTNSMARVFSDCERKFVREYLERREPDSDYEEPNYFAFGTTVHEILELSKHDERLANFALISQVCSENGLGDVDKAKVMAVLRSYFGLHLNAGLKPVAFEVRFQNDLTMGSVDLILANAQGQWWICDVKTVGIKLDPSMKVKLQNDQQMNLYAAFHDVLAEKLGLDAFAFQGVRYREIEKPRERVGKNETPLEFSHRLVNLPNPVAREIVLGLDDLNWQEVYQNFLGTLDRARALQVQFLTDKAEGQANFNNCVKFGSPCPFYSGCYGSTYKAAKEKPVDETLPSNDSALLDLF